MSSYISMKPEKMEEDTHQILSEGEKCIICVESLGLRVYILSVNLD